MTTQPYQITPEDAKILCKAFEAKMEAFYHLGQHVATLASGALAVTVTFITVIGKTPVSIWILRSGWLCFVFAVVGFILIHMAKVESYDIVLDSVREGRGLPITVSPKWYFHLGRWLLIGGFLLGLILLAVYGAIQK